MKNKFIYKCFFIITFLSLMFTTLFNTDVKASETDVYNSLPDTVFNTVYSLENYGSSNYMFVVFKCPSYSFYRCLVINRTLYPDAVVNLSNYIQIDDVAFDYFDISLNGSILQTGNASLVGYYYREDLENENFLFKNIDVYKNGELFFQKPPLGITQTLVEETEKVQIAEQLRTMIVGFLKYLIALVISVIAFYKGWKFLSTQLKRS